MGMHDCPHPGADWQSCVWLNPDPRNVRNSFMSHHKYYLAVNDSHKYLWSDSNIRDFETQYLGISTCSCVSKHT